MPELQTHSPDNEDFARVVELAQLRETAEFTFDISPTEKEAAAIARVLDAQSIRKLRFRGALVPVSKGGWNLKAQLGATVVQPCVVTLEPVTTRVDAPVERRFVKDPEAQIEEIVVGVEDPDDVEPLPDQIDLGLIAIESLALAVPDYPRIPGAELEKGVFAEEGVQPLEDADLKPFAALAALKKQLGNG